MTPYVIVCESASGNTARLANGLQNHFRGQASFVSDPTKVDTESYDVYFVGSGIYNGDCSKNTASILERLKDKNVFVYGTCGFGTDEDYFETVAKRISSHVKQNNHLIGHYVCSGKLPDLALSRFEKLHAANPDCPRWTESIANYYKTTAHPNQDDVQHLISAADQALRELAQEN